MRKVGLTFGGGLLACVGTVMQLVDETEAGCGEHLSAGDLADALECVLCPQTGEHEASWASKATARCWSQ